MGVVVLWISIVPLAHAREQAEVDDQPRGQAAKKKEK